MEVNYLLHCVIVLSPGILRLSFLLLCIQGLQSSSLDYLDHEVLVS